MYDETGLLSDGREVMFSLYIKKDYLTPDKREYELLGEFASMNELLDSTIIQGKPFKEIIMDDDTELVGQD